MRLSVLLAVGVWLAGCGVEAPELPEAVDPPERTAAQDVAIRDLMVDVAAHRICGQLEGQLLALPETRAPSGAAAGGAPAVGRLWIEGCRAERRAERRLWLRLEGRGWTWVDEQAGGPLASRFAVQGHLRFRMSLELTVEIDVAYDRRSHVATMWLTPREVPAARVTPLGELPIQAEGGWSGLIGRLGEVLGGPLSDRAAPLLAAQASGMIASRLRSGLTVTMDLCNGQLDTLVGALAAGQTPERPYEGDGRPWIVNERALLHGGGLDAVGPLRAGGRDLEVEIDVEEGPAVEARLLCREEAERVVESYVGSRPSSPVRARARHRVQPAAAGRFEVDGAGCDLVLVLTPRADAPEPTRVRYRVRAEGASAEGLVGCEPR